MTFYYVQLSARLSRLDSVSVDLCTSGTCSCGERRMESGGQDRDQDRCKDHDTETHGFGYKEPPGEEWSKEQGPGRRPGRNWQCIVSLVLLMIPGAVFVLLHNSSCNNIL